MQFHGLFEDDMPYSTTLRRELDQPHHGLELDDADWMSMCAQLLEAFDYLHTTAEIIHNDASSTNVILGIPATLPPSSVCMVGAGKYQILVIDFGKATKATQGNFLYLNSQEKKEYQRKFPQIAPEVIEVIQGNQYLVTCTLLEDYFTELLRVAAFPPVHYILNVAEKCRIVQYFKRLTVNRAIQQLQDSACKVYSCV